MVRRFRGEFDQKVDGKGRMSIPASFRRVLEQGDPNWSSGGDPEIVIVYGDSRRQYLECYTVDAANEVDAQIAELPRGSMERRMLERLFNGQSLATSIDNTGRIVLPQKLRDKIGIGLNSEVYMLATGDTFQIWNPKTFSATEDAKTEAWLDDQPEDFDLLTLLDRRHPEPRQ
ncbi:MAG: division/cell wall cluster transcriptional repressor MraZ [Pseudomonadota bacterium]